MGIKRFNLVSLLDLTNVIRPNESNPDGESFCGGLNGQKHPLSYRPLFPHVSEWENVFLGHITSRGGRRNCNTNVWPQCQFGFNDCMYYIQYVLFINSNLLQL